jgi:hypothetical protein
MNKDVLIIKYEKISDKKWCLLHADDNGTCSLFDDQHKALETPPTARLQIK